MGTKEKDVEKRLFHRVNVEFPVELSLPKEVDSAKGECKDVAAAGMRLVTKRQFPLNRDVVVKLRLPDQHKPYNVKARAVWSKEISKGVWQMGLNFQDIDLLKHWRIFRLPGVRKPIF